MSESRTAIVTGAASGIGLELSRMLARDGWGLILVVRPGADVAALRSEVAQKGGGDSIAVVHADLADRRSIAAAITTIQGSAAPVKALINNAGVLGEAPAFNAEGVELHLAVNVLAPYLLMQGLRSKLASQAPAAIINVSSGAAVRAGGLDLDELRQPKRFRKLFGSYAQSKLALSLMTTALAGDYAKDGVHVLSVDPGPNKTKMTGSAGMPALLVPIRNLAFPGPRKGASHVLFGLEAALAGRKDGAYYTGDKPQQLAGKEDDVQRLLRLLAELSA